MNKLNKHEEEKIQAAIRDLEKDTSGEFVPCISNISDHYDEGTWYLTTMAAFIIFLFLIIGSYLWIIPSQLTYFQVGLYSTFFVLGILLLSSFLPSLRLLFIPEHKKMARVNAEAERIFLSEEVFKTHHRTGILLYISIKERKVVILGDTGINQQVKQEEWDKMVDIIVTGIKNNQLADAIVKAIGLAKQLLMENEFPKRDSPDNELSNRIRYR